MQGMKTLHLRELVGGASGDLCHPQQGELRLQVLELAEQVNLRLGAQLVDLNPRYNSRRRTAAMRAMPSPRRTAPAIKRWGKRSTIEIQREKTEGNRGEEYAEPRNRSTGGP